MNGSDPLGLTPEQRRVSDASERYGAYLGPMMADLDGWQTGIVTAVLACGHCRQIQGHVASCPTNMVIEGEWIESAARELEARRDSR